MPTPTPTLSDAETPVGALSSPESSRRLGHREREGDQPLAAPGHVGDPARGRHRLRPRATWVTTAVKSCAPESSVGRNARQRSRRRGAGLGHLPRARGRTAGVAAATGSARTRRSTTITASVARRCHGDQRAERRGNRSTHDVLTQPGARTHRVPRLLDVEAAGRSGWESRSSSSAGWWPSGASRSSRSASSSASTRSRYRRGSTHSG